MPDKYEPTNEFVEKLEWEIRREIRRRNRPAHPSRAVFPFRWMPQSRGKAAFAVMGLILVSMGLGGAAVAAAYQVQGKQSRDVLISGLERRADLARDNLKIATEKERDTERQVSLGSANQENVLEGRAKVAQANALLKSIESQIEEVRITGREPVNGISAPLISGRDFVSERLRIQATAPQAELEFERLRLHDIEKQVAIGATGSTEVDVSRTRTTEIESAVEGFQRKIEIRQEFLGRKINAATVELRLLEIEAEQRRKTLAPKVDLARKESQNTATRVRMGLASNVDQAEAALRLQQLETELAQADLDLARVRRQLDQRRSGR